MAPRSASAPARAGARTREAILDAALAVWSRDRTATLADVAEVAGVHRSTVHRGFADRAGLVDALVRRCVDEVVAATRAAELDRGRAAPAVRRTATALLHVGDRIRFLYDDPETARHPAMALLDAPDSPLAAVVRRAQAEGGVDPGVPPAWVERVVWSLVYAASEAVQDGVLTTHEALEALQRTLGPGLLSPPQGDPGGRRRGPEAP